jgi:succinyl-CoA synthetase alpha subunit
MTWHVTNSGWIVDSNMKHCVVAHVPGFNAPTDPELRARAAQVARLIVAAPQAKEVIQSLMTVDLRNSKSLHETMALARAWLKSLEPPA